MVRKILSFGLGPIVSALLGLLIVPLLSWYFPPAELGKMNIFLTLSAGATNILVLGLDQSYVRFYSSVKNKNVLFFSCLVPIVVVLLLLTAIFINVNYKSIIYDLFETKSDFTAIAFILSIWMIVLIRMLSLVPRMEGKGFSFSLIQITRKLAVIIIIPLVVINKSSDPTVLIQFFSVTMTFIVALVVFKTSCITHTENMGLVSGVEYKEIISYGAPLIISGALFWSLISFDRIALKFFHGSDELGVYSLAISLCAFMTVAQSIFSTMWYPVAYKWFDSKITDKFNVVTELTISGCSIVVLLYCLFSPLIKFFIPEEYYPAIELSKLIIMYPYFYIISEVAGVGLNLLKKTKIIAGIMFVCFLLNILLNVFFTSQYGGLGASLSIALTFFAYMFGKVIMSKSMGHYFIDRKSAFIIASTCFLMALEALDAHLLIDVLLFIFILFLVYLVSPTLKDMVDKKNERENLLN